MRKEFEITQEQLDKLMDASRPTLAIALQCGPAPSVQENANNAWHALGKELGFDSTTVQPCGKGHRFFTATVVVPAHGTADRYALDAEID